MSEVLDMAPIPPRSLAGIGALRNQPALLDALKAEFGAAPPATAGFVRAGDITLSRLSPNRLLITAPRDIGLIAWLERLAGLACVTDQSDQWSAWHLSGPAPQDTLARLVAIDVSVASFPIGALALTRCGHLHVRLWHLADSTYEIAVSRSHQADLHHALQAAGKAVLF